MTVRPFSNSDLEAVVALVREIDATAVITPGALAVDLSTFPGDRFVAVVDGQVVGWAPSYHRADGAISFSIGVLPGSRRHGLGGALFSALEQHLDRVRSRTYAEDADACRFLEVRGYAAAGQLHLATLDLMASEQRDAGVPGFRAVPLSDLLDRLVDVHRVYAALRADIPREHLIAPVPFAEFRAQIDGGLFDGDASVIVLDGIDPVALSFVATDREGGRAAMDVTGTLSGHRRRGLARFAKEDSLRRLRALGIHTLVTSNDATNKPMLTLNHSLGFRRAATWTRYSRQPAVS